MSSILFVSFELYPTTWGGCGVLLNNAAHLLLDKGHKIIFLLDIPEQEYNKLIEQDLLEFTGVGDCLALRLACLTDNCELTQEDFPSIFQWQSYRWDYACRKICDEHKIDIIEFYDYCGPGYCAVNAKIAGLAYADTQLAIRLHNTRELIDIQEPTKGIDFANLALYGLEHHSLRLAEAVLYPSKTYYEESILPYYEPWFGEVVESESPIIKTPNAPGNRNNPDKALFYGRLFGFKGVDCFVDAAVAYLDNPTNPRLKFCIVGYDSNEPPIDVLSYQDFLELKIPHKYSELFEFIGHLPWGQLEELLSRVLFAVFPSYLESFCYAAHEIYATGTPIIVSDIPGFKDFFHHGENALCFDGTVGDLTRQMERLSADSDLHSRLSFPFTVTNNPLGGFYTQSKTKRWISCAEVNNSLLICVIFDGDVAACQDTLVLVGNFIKENSASADIEVIVLERNKDNLTNSYSMWFLGALYTPCTQEGSPVATSTIKTKENLLILKAGDLPQHEYISRSLAILGSQKEISFVNCWKEEYQGKSLNKFLTFPYDAMPEQIVFQKLSPLTRSVMRTESDKLLIDIFDPRMGMYGEISYLLSLDLDDTCGCVIPKVLFRQKEESLELIDMKTLSLLLMNDNSYWHKRRLTNFLGVLAGEAFSS